jgi:RimJ/RimL family protein N-acetyltransferase
MDPLLIDIPEEISTQRLILRAPHEGEAEEMNRAIQESIEEVRLWMPWAQTTPTLEETRVYCRQALAWQVVREEISYRLYLREGGGFAGSVSLCRINWKVPRFELGYWMRTSLCGRGYMTEAATALRDFALEKLSARRIELRIDEKNGRSRRLAERLGFEMEGVLRNFEHFPSGSVRNICVYSVIGHPGD